ncbi:MAG: ABC transporter permease [Flavobacteriales bacterium]|nr:ABC transporter permease [Flavobacteriales bacterium]
MITTIPTFIAHRYLTSVGKKSAVGIITVISIFGVAVGAFAMFVVLSVFSGLRDVNEQFMGTMDPALKITPLQGKVFTASHTFLDSIKNNSDVSAVSCVLQEKAFAQYRTAETIVRIKGVDENYSSVVPLDSTLVAGHGIELWTDEDYTGQALMGMHLAYTLGVNVMDMFTPLHVYVPTGNTDVSAVSTLFKSVDIRPVGVFSHKDYDATYVIAPISVVRRLLGRTEDEVSSVEISLKKGVDADKTALALQDVLKGKGLQTKTLAQQQEMMYRIMNTENVVLYFIFALIIAIALFNVVGAVVMLIIDKKDNIRTMWALGLSISDIRSVFIREGMMTVAVGAVIGLALAVVLVWMQAEYSIVMIEGNMNIPYPIKLTFFNVLTVIFTIFILGYVASVLSVTGIKSFFKE